MRSILGFSSSCTAAAGCRWEASVDHRRSHDASLLPPAPMTGMRAASVLLTVAAWLAAVAGVLDTG